MNEVYTDLEGFNKVPDTLDIKDPTKLLKLAPKNQEYFTPSLEDIRVGYECETQVDPYPDWVKTIIQDGDCLNFIINKDWQIRVPYLSKEQIETEGWKFKGKSIDLWWEKEGSFKIGNWTSYKIVMHYGMKGHTGNQDNRLYIYAEDQGSEHRLFEGECKDINTFWYICKLLNI